MSGEISFLQITDTHIKAGAGPLVDGAETAAALRRAVAEINALAERVGGIDAVIHTGDLVDEGLPEEYAEFNAIVAGLAPPLYALPGNHDARGAMRAAGLAPDAAPAEGPIRAALDIGPARAILMDSVVPGASHGRLGEEQIAWAAGEIDRSAAEGRPALLFAHHPPFASGVGYMDEIRLEDGPALAAMIAERPNVRLFACGHHHRTIVTMIGGAPAIAAPATAVQLAVDFRRNADPIPTAEESAVVLHVWRPAPAPYGAVSSYVSAF